MRVRDIFLLLPIVLVGLLGAAMALGAPDFLSGVVAVASGLPIGLYLTVESRWLRRIWRVLRGAQPSRRLGAEGGE